MGILEKIGDNYHELIMLARELGQRQPHVEAGTEQA